MSTSRDNERSTKGRSLRLSLVFEEYDEEHDDDKSDNAGDVGDAALEDVFEEEGIELALEAIESVVEKLFEDVNELRGVPTANDQKVLMGDDSDSPVKKLLQEILDIANETKDENEHNAIVKKLEALKSELLGVPIPMAPSIAAPPPPPPPPIPPPPPPQPAKVQLRKKKVGNAGIRISKIDVKVGTYI